MLLDADEPRVLGFDVLCGDGSNRFLPFTTARYGRGALEIGSTLMLLDARELEFYRNRGRSLARAPELSDAFVDGNGGLVIPLTARC